MSLKPISTYFWSNDKSMQIISKYCITWCVVLHTYIEKRERLLAVRVLCLYCGQSIGADIKFKFSFTHAIPYLPKLPRQWPCFFLNMLSA